MNERINIQQGVTQAKNARGTRPCRHSLLLPPLVLGGLDNRDDPEIGGGKRRAVKSTSITFPIDDCTIV